MMKIFDRLLFIFYSLTFFITSLLMYAKTSEIFEFNKMLFIYFSTLLILSTYLMKIILQKKIIIEKTPFDIPILLFLTSQIISTFFSIDRHTSFFGYYGRFNGGLLSIVSYLVLNYLFIFNFSSEKIIVDLLKISLVASMIVILWGLPAKFGYDLTCYLFTGELSNHCWTPQFKPQERMFSTLGQPNWLGAYLVINFFLGLFFFLQKKTGFFYFSYLVLNFSAVLFTRSRSALLAWFFGYFLFFLIAIIIDRKKILKKFFLLTFFLFFVLALFKTGIPKIDQFLGNLSFKQQKNPSFKTYSLTSQKITDSGEIRKIVWKGAIELGKRYPFFGTGVETFAYAYYFVRPKEHNLTSEWDFIYNKAHNEFLNYLATTGVFGLVTYLLLIFGVIFLFIHQLKKNYSPADNFSPVYDLKLLFLSLFVSYLSILITNFFGFSTTTINLFFYLIPAFLVVLSKKATRIDEKKKEKNVYFQSSQILLLIFPLIILIFGIFGFLVPYFFADIYYAKANNFIQANHYSQAYFYLQKALNLKKEHVYEDKMAKILANLAFILNSNKDKENKLEIEIDRLISASIFYHEKSLKSSPKNVLYLKTRAQIFYLFYQIKKNPFYLEETINSLEKAIKLAPTDPRFYFQKALILFEEKKDTSTALKLLEKAIFLKSDYRDGYWLKGVILKKIGKKQEAKTVFEKVLKEINPEDEEIKSYLKDL